MFTNRNKKSIRLLYWDKTGFAMWMKTLEIDTFPWPKASPCSSLAITSQQIEWLLAGINPWKIHPHKEVNFSIL